MPEWTQRLRSRRAWLRGLGAATLPLLGWRTLVASPRATRSFHLCLSPAVVASDLEWVEMVRNAGASTEVFTGEDLNEPFTVHGRFRCVACGGKVYRIWIVGSKRVLSVEGKSTPALEKILKILEEGDGRFTRDLFADFTVEPLARDIKGHMRPVRILEVKRVVIATREGKFIAKRDRL